VEIIPAIDLREGRCVRLVHGEMDMYYHQRSEPWQESERGERFFETLESVGEVSDILKEVRY